MGRSACCEKPHVKKGAWTEEEDDRLASYIRAHGEGCWRSLPLAAGLRRCGKSCRLRWINYLRPGLKRGNFTQEEDELIIKLHARLGNKWSTIAERLPGRTDNEIKNYWNTHMRRKLPSRGVDRATQSGGPGRARRPELELSAGVAGVEEKNRGMLSSSSDCSASSSSWQTIQRSRCSELNLELRLSPPLQRQEDILLTEHKKV